VLPLELGLRCEHIVPERSIRINCAHPYLACGVSLLWHHPFDAKRFLLAQAGERDFVTDLELSVEALQGGSLPADVNGYDFLVESVAAGVGPGKPNWQRHVDPWRVAALDFESSHEAAQLCRYIGQVLSRFLRLLRVY
jgi:hypothetical protein